MLRRIPALLVGLVLAFATATSAAASDPSSAQEWERSIAERAQERPPAGDGLADPLEVRTGVDPVGDAFWPRGDIVEYGARYDDFVRVGAATALVSSPDSAPWIWGITAHMWEIDVNGDGVEDYLVFFGNPGGGGPIGEVTLPDAVTHVCDGVAWYDAVGGYFVDFAPSCIGAPPSFRYTVFASYDDAGVISVDWAPDVGWAGPITRGAPAPPPPPQVGGVTADDGYWLATMDGQVAAFGDRADHGSLTSLPNLPVVGMASTPTDGGYWLVASDGGIFAFGDAGFHGSTGAIALNQPIVGMAPTPTGLGYWLVASDGGIFAFGDAGFHGSTGAIALNQPIVGMAPTPTGLGYWLVAEDGGIFAFGDAGFHGSTGAIALNQPIVGMTPSPSGQGYWLVASDGGIFAFGDAGFHGSTGAIALNHPIVGMTPSPSGQGYRFVAADGGVFVFGDAGFYGSLGGIPLAFPVIAMAA